MLDHSFSGDIPNQHRLNSYSSNDHVFSIDWATQGSRSVVHSWGVTAETLTTEKRMACTRSPPGAVTAWVTKRGPTVNSRRDWQVL